MAHGQFVSAFQLNWLGPVGFSIVLAQIPIRGFKLWQGPPAP
jgi:hypothetical protein